MRARSYARVLFIVVGDVSLEHSDSRLRERVLNIISCNVNLDEDALSNPCREKLDLQLVSALVADAGGHD